MSVGAFTTGELNSPAVVMHRLQEIERDLAKRQNSYENAAGAWYTAQREIKKTWAMTLVGSAASSVTAQKAEADIAASVVDGVEHEAEYEALKAVISVLDKRAMICMAILKAQGRA